MLRKIYYLLTPSLRRSVRRIWFLPLDTYVLVSGKREPLVPPAGLIFTGAGDFKAIGEKLVNSFITWCHLQPTAKVLDVGCGIGRVARPLTKFLNQEGAYWGFDIVRLGISWCKRAYRNFPNFHFQYIPLRNDLYNLSTKAVASAFHFPYPSDHFDLVVLISVFTHMQEADVGSYFFEIARVLKKGQSCFCTFFLITKESDDYLKNSPNPFFKFRYDHYFLHDSTVKDANIAYKWEVVETMIQAAGMQITQFFPGWWAGREKEHSLDFQDVLIITKSSGTAFFP